MNRLALRVPEDFPKIQDAINAAAEGATVLIGAGLYKENLQIGKSLRLVGTGQAQVQIRGADANKSVISVVSKVPIQVYFQGFTLGDLSATAPSPSPQLTAGLFIAGPVQAILRQVTIAGLGAGVAAFSLMPGEFDPALISFQPQTVLEEVRVVRNGGGILGASVYVSILRSELSENGMGFTGDLLYMVKSTVRKNQLWGVNLEFSGYYGPQHLGRLDSNEIAENGVGVVLRAGEDATNSWLWMDENRIIKNQEYGIVVLSRACPMAIPPLAATLGKESASIRIYGSENELRDNAKADLCPSDYPWPPGFRK
ncbi:MAG: hypothetical protein NZ610_07725 [Candidatus Bipolaricaulota bacterium]|nr:hypothetical protein [Candidatus Bipolaricaulota bacterium]